MRVAIRERIQPRPEHYILSHSPRISRSQFVLSKAAARHHERTKGPREGRMLFRIAAQFRRGLAANDAQSQRIVEHARLIKKLMRGPANRYPLRRSAEFPFLHVRSE